MRRCSNYSTRERFVLYGRGGVEEEEEEVREENVPICTKRGLDTVGLHWVDTDKTIAINSNITPPPK